MQYEITKTFNRIRSERSLTPARRNLAADRTEHRLHATRDAMEAKYFRDSSGESPISRFAAHVIAMILAKRRLLLHISPPYNQHSHSLPPRTCDLLFLLGIHVLELSRPFKKLRVLNAGAGSAPHISNGPPPLSSPASSPHVHKAPQRGGLGMLSTDCWTMGQKRRAAWPKPLR